MPPLADFTGPEAVVRPMASADIPAADELRQTIGWNQPESHWRMLLDLEPSGCFAATFGDALAGTVTATTYEGRLAWVGMMMVHPELRGRGLARRLMTAAIEGLRARGVASIYLDATPAGRPVYEKLGFGVRRSLLRWRRPPGPLRAGWGSAADARPLEREDWPAVTALDHRVMGVDRSLLLLRLLKESRCALVWPALGPVRGWGMLRPGVGADALGPLEAADPAAIAPLAGGLVSAGGGRAVVCDLCEDQEAGAAAALDLGFSTQRSFARMCLGDPLVPSHPALAAIADPSVG